MPKYAVKIGEIMLTSDEPITTEQRKQALEEVKRADALIVTADGLVVKLTVDRH